MTLYHLVVIDSGGDKTYITKHPITYEEACVIKEKLSHHNTLHVEAVVIEDR